MRLVLHHLRRTVCDVFGFAVAGRRYGVALVVVLGALAVVFGLAVNLLAPVFLYPFI